MQKVILFCNKIGVKIVSLFILVITTYNLGKTNEVNVFNTFLAFADIAALSSLLTVLFALDLEKANEQKNSDKQFYAEIIAQLPYDDQFRNWFGQFDHGNSFDDRYLIKLYGVNDRLFTNEIKCFHSSEIEKNYKKFTSFIHAYLGKMSSYTGSSGTQRGRVYPLEENNAEVFWQHVRELNEEATKAFNSYKDFHIKAKSELSL